LALYSPLSFDSGGGFKLGTAHHDTGIGGRAFVVPVLLDMRHLQAYRMLFIGVIGTGQFVTISGTCKILSSTILFQFF
jgi:hypothetical protein